MPLTQEKPRFENGFTNNNDHSYLHKKFKKMACTFSVAGGESEDYGAANASASASAQQHRLSAAQGPAASPADAGRGAPDAAERAALDSRHIVEANSTAGTQMQSNVQIYFNDNSRKVSDVNKIDKAGETSYPDENLNKTDYFENDVPRENINGSVSGRHVCPYCSLSCAKPSVLQKHIRAHTNERPYPCVTCGFAFKTKSNLYKHKRSRTHALRVQGVETAGNEDESSPDSESDGSLPAAPAATARAPVPVPSVAATTDASSERYLVRQDSARASEISSPENSLGRATPPVSSSLKINCDSTKLKTIYKPKFRVSNYQADEEKNRKMLSPNPDFLNEHISKIISDNEAIVDVLETPLQKKYGKIKQIAENRLSIENSSQDIKLDSAMPLNLSKVDTDVENSHRKRSYSENFAQLEQSKHPLNPEGSIIKDLLLKTKASGNSLLPLTPETYDGTGLFVCPICQVPYKTAENLEIHRMYYCKGQMSNSNISNTTNTKEQKLVRAEHIFVRSNSINVRLPESMSPNSNRSVSSSPKAPQTPPTRSKPDNLVIIKPESCDILTPLPSPGPLLGNTRLVDTRTNPDHPKKNDITNVRANLSPKRRLDSAELGCPRLGSPSPRPDAFQTAKVRCFEAPPIALRTLDELSQGSARSNSASLQMFGGEVKIIDHSGGTTTFRIEPSKSQQSPVLLQQTPSPSPSKPAPDDCSSVVVRSNLHSGGTIMHNPATSKEANLQAPRIVLSLATSIPTPSINVTNIPTPNIAYFQFPPLSAITDYNPLTLPPLNSAVSPSGAVSILHGGKIIPHVPGMPGPNSGPQYLVGTSTPHSQARFPTVCVDAIKTHSHKEETPQSRQSSNMFKSKIFSVQKSDTNSNTATLPRISISTASIRDKELCSMASISPLQNPNSIPTISIRDADEPSLSSSIMNSLRPTIRSSRMDSLMKRKADLKQPALLLQESPAEKKGRIELRTPEVDSKSEPEVRHFNFENLITKAEIKIQSSSEVQKNTNAGEGREAAQVTTSTSAERSEPAYFQKGAGAGAGTGAGTGAGARGKEAARGGRFLRPSSLPLRPGTFLAKRHHGITPTANTLPLVSPETPRPAKAYGQLYLNGNAYTYLGLKCSTKVFYCTVNRPQPTYVPNQHFLSMYSNWQLLSELTPHPLGLAPALAMALYDSRHRPQGVAVAAARHQHILTHSSRWNNHSASTNASTSANASGNSSANIASSAAAAASTPVSNISTATMPGLAAGTDDAEGERGEKPSVGGAGGACKQGAGAGAAAAVAGGFESLEEYTYVRGRGRGRYVCCECGIRCKKPSMLKKHLRTHTDLRPYTCTHCAFSFKTKGNLTKHMKSKTHYKKCYELRVSPAGGEGRAEPGAPLAPMPHDSDSDTDSDPDPDHDPDPDDGADAETESSDTDSWKSRLPEHEAAQSLLSLGAGATVGAPAPGLVSAARPSTYPYTPAQGPELEPAGPAAGLAAPAGAGDEPMDLSRAEGRGEARTALAGIGVERARESSVLASLAANTAKLPPAQPWAGRARAGEPLLHAYLTERALLDTRIKQSQLLLAPAPAHAPASASASAPPVSAAAAALPPSAAPGDTSHLTAASAEKPATSRERLASPQPAAAVSAGVSAAGDIVRSSPHIEVPTSTENAKFVASEYLKMAKSKLEVERSTCEDVKVSLNGGGGGEGGGREAEGGRDADRDGRGCDAVASKVVIGAGGVAFKVAPKGGALGGELGGAGGALGGAGGALGGEEGRAVCAVCSKSFSKPSQLRLHINIHYMERPFRCSACAVSFRTRGHLQKHERSGSHHNKVSMTSAFGAATSLNPRPFRCADCNIAFRIHGHLAKHLRSKMHVMRLECLGKLPFGTFTEMERAGVSLSDIDTTDCANSLASLQLLAQRLHARDPSTLAAGAWDPATMVPPLLPAGHESSDDEDAALPPAPVAAAPVAAAATVPRDSPHDAHTDNRTVSSATHV